MSLVGKLCRFVDSATAAEFQVVSDTGRVLATVPYTMVNFSDPPQYEDRADMLFRWRLAHLNALSNAMGCYSHAVPVEQVERDAISAIEFAKAHGWERGK